MSGIRGSEGDTGAQRPGGIASSDAFTKREAALENQYIHQKEMEKYAFRAPSDVMNRKADTGSSRMKAQSDKLAAQGKSAQGEKK